MNQQDEQFLTTRQEPLRLSIALSRYFGREPLTDEWKERYHTYLQKRIRAVIPEVIKRGDFRVLVMLAEEGFLTGALYQEAILRAADFGRTEMTVFLLRNQERLSQAKNDSYDLDF